jgi:hypothetical protein
MSQIVSDDFNRGNSTGLGSNWTGSVGGGYDVVSNQASKHGGTNTEASVFTGASWTGGNDHYSEVSIITKTSGNDASVTCRASSSAETYYVFQINDNDAAVALGSSMRCGMYKVVAGTYTLLGSTASFTVSTTDTMRVEAQGTSITSKLNGTTKFGPTTDSGIASGKPGIMGFTGAASSIFDNFAAGDFISATLSIIGWRKNLPQLFGPLGRFQPPRFQPTSSSQALTLSVSDSLTLTDSIIKDVSKPISDTITLTDAATKLFGKVLSDSITLTDAVAKLVGKALSDSIALTDSKILTVGKVLSDTIALTDSLAKAVTKALSDTITATDSKALLTGKVLSDSVALTDLKTFLVSKALSDSLVLTDTRALLLSKVFSDSITLSDTATAVLVLLLHVSDSFALTDSAAMVLATACKQLLGCGDNPYSFDSSTASSPGACGKSIAGCPTNEYSFNE